MGYLKQGDAVCVWFDCEDGQRMGTPGVVANVNEETGAVTVHYMILGSKSVKIFTAGQARSHITKFDE